jgi:hypothetical protein
MWPIGAVAGAARRIPASSPAFSGTRFGWLVGPWEWPARGAPTAAAGSAAARQVLAGAGKGVAREGEGEVYAHKREDRPLICRRRAPDSSGRTAGLPGAPTAVRRRRAEHAAARPPRRLGARNLGACCLVSRASLGQGARPRSAGRHRTPGQHGARVGAARRGTTVSA